MSFVWAHRLVICLQINQRSSLYCIWDFGIGRKLNIYYIKCHPRGKLHYDKRTLSLIKEKG